MPEFLIDVKQNRNGSGEFYVIVFGSRSDAEVFCQCLIEHAEKHCNEDGRRFVKRFTDSCLKKLTNKYSPKGHDLWSCPVGLTAFANLFLVMFAMFDNSEDDNAYLLSLVDRWKAICEQNKETLAEKDGAIDVYKMAFAPLGTGADYRGVCS